MSVGTIVILCYCPFIVVRLSILCLPIVFSYIVSFSNLNVFSSLCLPYLIFLKLCISYFEQILSFSEGSATHNKLK